MTDARLQNNSKMMAKAIILAVIVAVISLQTYAGIVRMACTGVEIPLICNVPEDPSLYPFLNYPMYSNAKPEGVTVPKFSLIAVYQDGTEKQLTAEDFGLPIYWFNTGIIHAMNEKETAKINQFIETYQQT